MLCLMRQRLIDVASRNRYPLCWLKDNLKDGINVHSARRLPQRISGRGQSEKRMLTSSQR